MDHYVGLEFSPSRLPENLCAAIGHVVAASSQTEAILNDAIAGCLGLDAEYMVAVTQHMTLPLKYSVLNAVAEIRLDVRELDELDKLIAAVSDALEKRNGIVHDSWATNEVTGKLLRVKQSARNSVKTELVPVAVEQVLADAKEIEAAGLALVEFLDKQDLLPLVPPLRPRGHKTREARKKRRKTAVK
jgi:hypothetical protein